MNTQSFAMLIDGQPVTGAKTFPVINPATEQVTAEAPEVEAPHVEQALAAAEIQAGSVCVNEAHYAVHLPHGGVKQSGVGKECSHYSIEEYLTLKRVSVLM